MQDFRTRAPAVPIDSPERGLDIRVLVEVVSGVDLPVADVSSSDPYVIVRLGSQEVHRTKPIKNTYVTWDNIQQSDTRSLSLLMFSCLLAVSIQSGRSTPDHCFFSPLLRKHSLAVAVASFSSPKTMTPCRKMKSWALWQCPQTSF